MKKFVLTAAVIAAAAGYAHAGQAAQATPPAQAPAAAVTQPPAAPRMPASPPGTAATQVAGRWEERAGAAPRYRDGKWIVIEYSRPILRGRADVFGTGAEYGKTVNAGAPVWRAGANVTTRLKTEVPLVFGDKTVPAGDYSVFVDLKEGAWTLILSTQPYQLKYDANEKAATWGSTNYDATFDVARVPMKVTANQLSIDQLTFGFVNMTQQGGSLFLTWDKTMGTVDFKVGQ